MSRTVEEWIGKTDDSKPSTACMRRVLNRQGYLCAISGKPFVDGDKVEYDHIVPLWLGGANRESNLQAVHQEPHKRKTASEAKVRSKVNDIINKRLGLKKSKKPMPGSKASGWKKKMDGTVERRDP